MSMIDDAVPLRQPQRGHPQQRAEMSSSSSSSSYPSPTDTRGADFGYDRINYYMRSVLSHPVGLLLLAYFNDTDDTDDRNGSISTPGNSESSSTMDGSHAHLTKYETGGSDREGTTGDNTSNDGDGDDMHIDHDGDDVGNNVMMNDATPVGLHPFLNGVAEADNATVTRFFSVGDACGLFDTILEGSYRTACHHRSSVRGTTSNSNQDPAEQLLTRATFDSIKKGLKKQCKKKAKSAFLLPTLQVHHPYPLEYHPAEESEDRTDILISSDSKGGGDSNNGAKRGVVLLLEVGLENEETNSRTEKGFRWWKKVDQAVRHLEHMQSSNDQDSAVQFSRPTLLAVLTITRTGQGQNVAASATWTDVQSALLGVFLCTPRGANTTADAGPGSPPPGFRAALLRRDEFDTLHDASVGLGKVLRAALSLARLLHDVEGGGYCVFKNYQSLGRNCCRIGNKVLRAYDSRFRHTNRRPDLYGDAAIAPETRVVCRIVDANVERKAVGVPTRGFKLWDNRGPALEKCHKRLWLWTFTGELLVISTPYHDGLHYAQSPKDFIPIVEHLQKIHEKECVHGDIRCANIVFGKRIIDFDMGGRLADAPTYPPGYVSELIDGLRVGQGGGTIKKTDDWQALIEIMFHLHVLKPPEGKPIKSDSARKTEQDAPVEAASAGKPSKSDSGPKTEKDTLVEATSLEERYASFGDLFLDAALLEDPTLPGRLTSFLREANKQEWTVVHPTRFLRNWVNRCKGRTGMATRVSSDPATTGSPPKVEIEAERLAHSFLTVVNSD